MHLVRFTIGRYATYFVYFKFPSYQFLHYLKRYCSSIMSNSYSHQLLKLVYKQISYKLLSHSTAQNLFLEFPNVSVIIRRAPAASELA